MKKLILLFIILLHVSCNSDNEIKDKSLVGTWKLSEANIGDGGIGTKWVAIKSSDSYTYTFKSDGTFTSTRFNDCRCGKYSLSTDLLTLDFDCPDFTSGIESPSGTYIENYKQENGKMILSPTYLSCIEGCLYKFKKIN